MKLLDTTHQLYTKEDAIETARVLNSFEEDDWTYKPVHCPKGTGYSFIEVYDEGGNFVERF